VIVTSIVCGVVAALGLLLVRVMGKARRRNNAFNRRAVQATGRGVAVQPKRVRFGQSSYRTVYIPTVEYSTPQGVLQTQGIGHGDAPPIGAELPLLYDGKRPSEVSFTGPRGSHGIANALLYAGWALVAIAVGMVALQLVMRFR